MPFVTNHTSIAIARISMDRADDVRASLQASLLAVAISGPAG
jgi:hypothetical protein